MAADISVLQQNDIFAGNVSNICIEPSEISINLQSDKINSLIRKPPTEWQKETIFDLVENVKGDAPFNFFKELENLETAGDSPRVNNQ